MMAIMKLHIDLDCFFVSAQRTIDPSLHHKPVIIGGRGDPYIFGERASHQDLLLDNSGSFVGSFFHHYQGHDLSQFIDQNGKIRGIVTTASYEARVYGITTGMSIREALGILPSLIVKGPDMKLYHRLSRELYDFLQERIPIIEQASIDEFYGDLEGWIAPDETAPFIDQLRLDIQESLHLPVSIGAAPSKYIAKIATESAKPFGCKVFQEEAMLPFIIPLKVSRFPGIGKRMQKLCEFYQIKTLGDFLRAKTLVCSWGAYAADLYDKVACIDHGTLQSKSPRKSIGISRTFDPISSRSEASRRILILARHLSYALSRLESNPTTFECTIRYRGHPKSYSAKTELRLFTERHFRVTALELFRQADIHPGGSIVNLGLGASHFTSQTRRTLSLLEFEEDSHWRRIDDAATSIRKKYGLDSLRWGSEFSLV